MRDKTLHYQASDVAAIGYLALPDAEGRRPGVLVAHEAPGLNAYARARADMLAQLGYVALAADLHGDGDIAATHEEAVQRVIFLRNNRDILRARVRSALDTLRGLEVVDPQRTAAIGYCFGGFSVLELARSGADVAGVVSFHGLLDCREPNEARAIRARVLVCTGADDRLVPPEQIAAFEAEMSAAGVDWQVAKYGGARHGFTNFIDTARLATLGFSHHPAADRRSWQLMRDFLDEVLCNPR